MIVQAIAFYLFASIAIAAAILVVSVRNPVHSVLFLILAFFNAAGLFVMMGAEFLAMILVVVYVGAVAVLFLFVVMMLDINFVSLRQGFIRYLPIGTLVGLILLAELVLIVGSWGISDTAAAGVTRRMDAVGGASNIEQLGRLIYTDYIYLFQAAGVILLVAMIGAIVLTLRHREGVKKQKIGRQIARKRAESVELKKVEPGEGI